jgi:hypothetical protein
MNAPISQQDKFRHGTTAWELNKYNDLNLSAPKNKQEMRILLFTFLFYLTLPKQRYVYGKLQQHPCRKVMSCVDDDRVHSSKATNRQRNEYGVGQEKALYCSHETSIRASASGGGR